jgi:ABC-2 type transport system ATP-binding protein
VATPAIQIEGLKKTFRIGFRMRRVEALVDANLVVPEGCVFGVVGPNGAGKTTMIKILMGLLRASAGTASIQGHPVPSVESRRRVGYLPEHPHFYDHLNPVELLGFVANLHGISGRQAKSKVYELLDFVGLSGSTSKPIRRFSKGMVQRLGIAQTLINDPSVIILDEPQSGLDPIGRKDVKDMIMGLKQKKRTVFFSSHILPDVEDVCDEIALLIDGRVREVGSVATLLDPQVLETEIEVANVDGATEKLLAESASRTALLGDSVIYYLPGHLETDEIVAKVITGGGQIRKLLRHQEQLEDVFVRETKAVRDAK